MSLRDVQSLGACTAPRLSLLAMDVNAYIAFAGEQIQNQRRERYDQRTKECRGKGVDDKVNTQEISEVRRDE